MMNTTDTKHSDSGDNTSALDLAKAMETLGDAAMVNQVLRVLQTELGQEYPQALQAHDRQQWALLQALLHKWLGSLSYFAHSGLVQRVRRLEQAAKQGDVTHLGAQFAPTMRHIEAFSEQLKAHLAANNGR